jgi:molecular chaperone GrpE
MVIEHDNTDVDFDVEDTDNIAHEDFELEDEEATGANKLKQLRQKLMKCDEEKRQILEDAAREKADFMNARRRLETERSLDKIRYTKKHIEELLPLADSFEMARSDKDAWEKADATWRKGIEGIHTQLQKLFESYGVSAIDPHHETFDPYRHEAIGMSPVDDESLHEKVISVLQKGYEIKADDKMEVIRPARVTTGNHTE